MPGLPHDPVSELLAPLPEITPAIAASIRAAFNDPAPSLTLAEVFDDLEAEIAADLAAEKHRG